MWFPSRKFTVKFNILLNKSIISPGPSFQFWAPERHKMHCCDLGQAEQQDKLGAHMTNPLFFDKGNVVFVGFMSSFFAPDLEIILGT
jgi:hypothetical protein